MSRLGSMCALSALLAVALPAVCCAGQQAVAGTYKLVAFTYRLLTWAHHDSAPRPTPERRTRDVHGRPLGIEGNARGDLRATHGSSDFRSLGACAGRCRTRAGW